MIFQLQFPISCTQNGQPRSAFNRPRYCVPVMATSEGDAQTRRIMATAFQMPLQDYSQEFQILARRLFQRVGEIVGSHQTKEYIAAATASLLHVRLLRTVSG